MNQKVKDKKKKNSNKNNSSNSLDFGRWPQTKTSACFCTGGEKCSYNVVRGIMYQENTAHIKKVFTRTCGKITDSGLKFRT